MKWETWFSIDWQQALGIFFICGGLLYGFDALYPIDGSTVVISKLSSHDFAMTVGIE